MKNCLENNFVIPSLGSQILLLFRFRDLLGSPRKINIFDARHNAAGEGPGAPQPGPLAQQSHPRGRHLGSGWKSRDRG